MAALAVRPPPLVVIGNTPLPELGRAVLALGTVALRIVHGDHEVFFEGVAAAFHVKVENFVEALELVVKFLHLIGPKFGLSAQGAGVCRHHDGLLFWAPVPNLFLPVTPGPERVAVANVTRHRCIIEILLAIHAMSDLAEPLIDPGHLVAADHLVKEELRQLRLAILVFTLRSIRHLWITRLPFHGPVRPDDPLAMGQLHVLELFGCVIRLAREVD